MCFDIVFQYRCFSKFLWILWSFTFLFFNFFNTWVNFSIVNTWSRISPTDLPINCRSNEIYTQNKWYNETLNNSVSAMSLREWDRQNIILDTKLIFWASTHWMSSVHKVLGTHEFSLLSTLFESISIKI